MVWKILFLLICTWLWENQWLRTWASTRPYYYGEHLTTNLASNGTDLIISISWRFSWSSQMQPSNEMLYYLCYDGTPCPSGPNYIRFMSQTAYCTTPGTSFDGTPYLPWVGIDSEFYYPLSTIPSNYSFIDMFVMDRDWGLVPIYTTAAYWTALINVMISRRTDTKEFNSSPRSSLTAIVVLYPQCGGWNFTISTSDPDGDVVRCRWSLPNTECNYCCQQSQIKYPGGYSFSLSDNCELTYTGGLVNSSMTYSVCIQMEDYYQATYANDWANYQAALVAAIGRNETVTPPQPLSTASLQFIVKISPDTTSPCVPVSPLFSDPCTLSCNRSISSLVPMAIVPTSYSNNVNSIVYLSCSNGYYAIPTILSVTCVQTSSPSAQWVVNGMCTSNNSSLCKNFAFREICTTIRD